jgi:heat shock protein HslJ
MKIFRHLLLPLSLLAFAGCDRTVSSESPADSQGTGALSFALPAALRAQVAGSADSLRVELRRGGTAKSRSVAFDSSVRFDGLDAGAWNISVGLYQAGGALTYYGEDSVQILPGENAKAVVTLRPAKGSVDVVIRLDSGEADPKALLGTWYLRQVDSLFVGHSIQLKLGDSGRAWGSDGCNGISGSYQATTSSIHFGSFFMTYMYCSIYQTLPSVTGHLQSAATWKVSDSTLDLFDSTGRTVLRYGRTALELVPPPLSTIVLDSVGGDTTGLALFALQLDSGIATDSGVLLSVTLPYPGLDIRLFELNPVGGRVVLDTTVDENGAIHYVAEPAFNPQILLVAGSIPPAGRSTIQILTPTRIFVPWSLVSSNAKFVDHMGRSFQRFQLDYRAI